MLAEEEAATVEPKKAPKPGAKKAKPAGSGAIAAEGRLLGTGDQSTNDQKGDAKAVESFEATGLDDALDLLTVVNAKSDKVSVGQQAAGLERHPEVHSYVHARVYFG